MLGSSRELEVDDVEVMRGRDAVGKGSDLVDGEGHDRDFV